ncbi:MAG: biotin--[acetyl-CoA-carboxylase] ligase [Acidobacteriota bacterium]|nr:biotin--[acetyl-CoA-carboxylase] ligase [Acidobacteriota bacterium]
MTDQLSTFDLSELSSAIAGTEFAGYLMHFPTVASTNDLALEAADVGARHGVWIADEQTAGRGRGTHNWHSTPGEGLYMTALISPPIPMQSALSLSLGVAIAVQSAIASIFGFRIPSQMDIRWPNDLLLNGKKCGGILIDTASKPARNNQPATLRYAVIGIGINLNHTTFPPELDPIATSLRRELPDPSQPLRREPLAAAILLALSDELRALTSNLKPRTSDPSTISTWITGKRVRVEPSPSDPAGAPGYTGTTAGLNPSGFLLVAGDDGQIHTVLSGGLREP